MGSWQERQDWNNRCWMGKQYVNDRAMTDEQMELLRRQIAAYITICEQLAEMHNAISTSTQQDRRTRLRNEPWMAAAGEKRTAKRWSSTPLQLQILERIFEEGNGTPSKQRIKEITTELAQHGQISEANVYNWFQNRRARLKRMQSVPEANMRNQNLRHKLNI